jgi:transposase
MGQEKMSHTLSPAQPQVTIGIDISKDRLDVHLHPAGLTRQFTNERKGHAELIAWAKPHCPSRIVFEATGAYHRALEMALGQAGLPAVKVNPLQVRRFAEAIGKRAKTDPVDAATLARFGTVLQPEVPLARDATLDQLAELLAARRALIKDRTAARNRGKTLTLALLKRQNKCHLQQIEAQIRAIDEAQAAILAGHAALQARFDILLSVPGLGAVTALALLIDMPELGSLDARQAASLAGVAPITRQSGRWQGKSRIQGGRAMLRRAIYMPALVAIRCNAPLRAKYQALCQAGKPAKVAIVAIMRKLIITANALLRDNRCWTPEAVVSAA